MAVCCSQRDVEQLKAILCTPSLNPDIRRAAADQLLALAPDPRFAQALSQASLLHALLLELTRDGGRGESLASGIPQNDETLAERQHQGAGDMQLGITCLHLLVGLVQHCPETKMLLLQGADRQACELCQSNVRLCHARGDDVCLLCTSLQV